MKGTREEPPQEKESVFYFYFL
ncbi:hypothetical protein MKR81_25630 [Vibrio campbellii]|nr:hypothetical protein [Vibrio campbellii]UMM06562.1 hypothetical protein MKR81_25630 [Vibrio campbellii]